VTAKPEPTQAQIEALVDRQARAWERNNFDLCAPDWWPDGELTSPGGVFPVPTLPEAMREFHLAYHDLQVTVKTVFFAHDATTNTTQVAVEWDWTVTRRSDNARGTTPDAIIADLKDGKIRSWREYFDLSTSVEAPATGEQR
jgi:ketosteroid isomerase-like protein